jgi:hypothetical protein
MAPIDSFTRLLARIAECERCQTVDVLCELRSASEVARAQSQPNLV